MAARMIDTEEEVGNPNNITQEESQTPAPQDKPEDDLPEKYRGKSIKDIMSMHQEAEKVIGRQGQDLGELRRVADAYIKASLQPKADNQPVQQNKPEPTTNDDDLEFFANPKAAISKALENHPLVKKLAEQGQQTTQEKAVNRLREAHPDAPQLLANPEFQEWVGKSQRRMAQLQHAHTRFDVAAADELLSDWKERQSLKAPKQTDTNKQAVNQARQANLNSAKVPSGTAAPETNNGKKSFRRADIVKLMNTDPRKYQEMLPVIEEAYREGRVR